jgi:hypothetical protein
VYPAARQLSPALELQLLAETYVLVPPHDIPLLCKLQHAVHVVAHNGWWLHTRFHCYVRCSMSCMSWHIMVGGCT